VPVVTDISATEDAHWSMSGQAAGVRQRGFQESTDTIEIGLLNNMPDQALRATERQFRELVRAAAGPRRVRLRRFFLADLPRSDVARAYLHSQYADTQALLRTRLDALIVTGQEPRAPRLEEEPYWRNLISVIDWAEDNTTSTIWSCLAAHAAVLHLDGIERHRLSHKLSGVFECESVEDNWLLHGLIGSVAIPHSRYNDLCERELVSKGYNILTRSARAGVDMFVKSKRSLFIFLQGHPEYDAHSLLGEYRRDIGRFLQSEAEAYPALPQSYFNEISTRLLADFAERAQAERRPDLLETFPERNVIGTLINHWRAPTVTIFRNWLDYLMSQKMARSQRGT
jgi:homoserine O-succinyltransferase/O-acetyltransferase